jgi:hypothetical protein
MKNPNKPTQEELDWMRAAAAEAERRIPGEIMDSIVAKGLVVREASGGVKPTEVGRRFIIGGC